MRRRIASEEAYLRRVFGEQYDLYREGRDAARREALRRALGPGGQGPRRWTTGGQGPPEWKMNRAIANREHRALVGLLVAVLLLVLKATYNGTL